MGCDGIGCGMLSGRAGPCWGALHHITERNYRIDCCNPTLIFSFDGGAWQSQDSVNQHHVLQCHISRSLQGPDHLLIYHFPRELSFAVDHWLFILISFQVLPHKAIVLLLPLISQLTEGLLILPNRAFVLFLTITRIPSLLTFLDQFLQGTHTRELVDRTRLFCH